MFGRILIVVLLVVSFGGGLPYAALLLNTVLGTTTAILTEHDGTRRTLITGRYIKHPDWVPMMPSTWVITGSQWISGLPTEPAGSVDLLSHASVEKISTFYTEALQKLGCKVSDRDNGQLAPETAAYLGIAKLMAGYCEKSANSISIRIGTPEGLLLPSRVIAVQWQRTVVPLTFTPRSSRL